jgi:hypothetical protein
MEHIEKAIPQSMRKLIAWVCPTPVGSISQGSRNLSGKMPRKRVINLSELKISWI